MTARDGEEGFFLLEVLVAFTIIAFGLVMFSAALTTQYRQLAEISMRESTLTHAQSHLETLGAAASLRPGDSTGTYVNGARWRLAVGEVATGDGGAKPSAHPLLVVLEAFDRAGHRVVHLKSVKLVPAQR